MSDEPTRVRISFTVELNEVPARISSLIDDAASGLDSLSVPLEETARYLSDDGNIAATLNVINETRVKLMAADLRLEDCVTLLANYQATQAELALEDMREEEVQAAIEQE
jgi:hypothetical protein|tara:strand:+ start:2946 stop:3275 length:330 start_codon:yes stop_codon:yes gene_type:complete